ncbi:MAG: Rrf2 family transcriptional regulator [Burkholderiales bacterium]|nr:Rrf2 family transcriptional regulator [Burkholderiales bacterium]
MRLQKNTQLALYSVLEFAARPGALVPAAEVADKYGESAHHLAKVLSKLARAGIVESVRGVGGGYRFVGNARRLTLLDVIRIMEDLEGHGEVDSTATTPAGRALAQVLAEIDQTTLATFGSITVATMLKMVDRAGAVR